MSTSSNVSLGALRQQARQRSDTENNNAITDAELNQYISQSAKELFDLVVSSYEDYHVATPYQFQTNNAQLYNFPDGTPTYLNTAGGTAKKLYKLLGVDLQYSASPTGWISLKRFEFIERNKYAYPNTTTNYAGWTNLRYRPVGNQLEFIPIPQTGQTVQLWYIPAPTSLLFMLPTNISVGSVSATMSDTTGLATGMNVYGTGIQSNTTIATLGSTSLTLSLPAQTTNVSAILSYWDDSSTFDGIAGWEEYIVIDAAIKCQIKQENPYDGLAGQKAAMLKRIEAMAVGRDSGQASHTSDVLSVGNYGYGGFGGGGDDMGSY